MPDETIKPRKIVITMRYRIPVRDVVEALGIKGRITYATYDWLTLELIIDAEEE